MEQSNQQQIISSLKTNHPDNFSDKEFLELDLNKVTPDRFVEDDKWITALSQMKKIKSFIDEEIRIIKKNTIPDFLIDQVNGYKKRFIDLVSNVLKDYPSNMSFAQISNIKSQAIQNFFDFHLELMNFDRTGYRFLIIYNTIKSYDRNSLVKEKGDLEYLKLKSEDLLEKIKNESIEIKEQVLQDKISTDNILKEMQKKASDITVSDYAGIFEAQSKEYNKASFIWLVVGVVLVIIFLCLIIFKVYENLKTEEIVGDVIKYNLSNVMIKILAFAVQIFLISFAFKQYSINKHLTTINKHRQNGFNSFKLFIETINKDDVETRNSLMLQLAKAVYEQANTGYINDKGQNINSGIVEITKMMGGNRTE